MNVHVHAALAVPGQHKRKGYGGHLLFFGLPCSLLLGGFGLQHVKAPLSDATKCA